MKSSSEYRAQAAQAMKGNIGTAFLMFLVMGLITSLLGITVIGPILVIGALTVGISNAMLRVIRYGGRMDFNDLFYGFHGPSFGATVGLGVKTAIFVMLWSMLFFVPGIIMSFAYSMAPFILADHPEMTGGEAITASKEMMRGYKLKLFCLELSYIGWILLSILTCGILLIWIEPKMYAAQAAFYEDLKAERNGGSFSGEKSAQESF